MRTKKSFFFCLKCVNVAVLGKVKMFGFCSDCDCAHLWSATNYQFSELISIKPLKIKLNHSDPNGTFSQRKIIMKNEYNRTPPGSNLQWWKTYELNKNSSTIFDLRIISQLIGSTGSKNVNEMGIELSEHCSDCCSTTRNQLFNRSNFESFISDEQSIESL